MGRRACSLPSSGQTVRGRPRRRPGGGGPPEGAARGPGLSRRGPGRCPGLRYSTRGRGRQRRTAGAPNGKPVSPRARPIGAGCRASRPMETLAAEGRGEGRRAGRPPLRTGRERGGGLVWAALGSGRESCTGASGGPGTVTCACPGTPRAEGPGDARLGRGPRCGAAHAALQVGSGRGPASGPGSGLRDGQGPESRSGQGSRPGVQPGSAPPAPRPRRGAQDPGLTGAGPFVRSFGSCPTGRAPRSARPSSRGQYEPCPPPARPGAWSWRRAATETFHRPEGPGAGELSWGGAPPGSTDTAGPRDVPAPRCSRRPEDEEGNAAWGSCPEPQPGFPSSPLLRPVGGPPDPWLRRVPSTRSGTRPRFAVVLPWAGSRRSPAFLF